MVFSESIKQVKILEAFLKLHGFQEEDRRPLTLDFPTKKWVLLNKPTKVPWSEYHYYDVKIRIVMSLDEGSWQNILKNHSPNTVSTVRSELPVSITVYGDVITRKIAYATDENMAMKLILEAIEGTNNATP